MKLYLAHPEEKQFLVWAKLQAEGALAKWQAHLLPPASSNGGTPQPPEGQFSVILADPPWRYDFSPTDSRKVENQYPTMEVEEICDLGEHMPFADNAVLFLWATAPKLRFEPQKALAKDIIADAGIEYAARVYDPALSKKR